MKPSYKRTIIKPALLLLIIIGMSFSPNSKNYITNAGFEKGKGNNAEGWEIIIPGNTTGINSGIDNSEYHSGMQSFRLTGAWTSPRRKMTLKTAKPIAIDSQNDYLLSFWYKTKGINEYPESFSADFVLKCENITPVRYTKKIHNSDSWSQYFILLDNMPDDARQLELSFNVNIITKGTIWLDDIEFREAAKGDVKQFEKWRRQPLPKVAGNASDKKFEATGFFKVEKASDRWWLVDPTGRPFWSIAIAGTRGRISEQHSSASPAAPLFNRNDTTSNQVNEKLYELFLKDLGFNSFAGWSSDDYAQISGNRFNKGEPYMPMTHVLGLSSASDNPAVFARDRNGNLLNRKGHEVPDPFNPEWRKMAREKAGKIIAPFRDKPWFLGWFTDNEMSFEELYRFIWADYSSMEFIRSLKEKYSSIGDLNQAWTSSFGEYSYKSFGDILSDKPEPRHWDDPLWVDFAAFERHMIAEYIDFTYNLVKELDPNHLVISNRINLGPMPDIYRTIDLWGKYDIVCMNIYPDNNKIGFNRGELEIMKKLHEGTGRPVIIGEWSIPSIDSGLYEFGNDSYNRPLDWSWPQVMRTQKERGEAYEMCLKQLASLEFMVGAGWFITYDVDTPERRSNRGILNSQNELYRDLTDSMQKTHRDVKESLHLKW